MNGPTMAVLICTVFAITTDVHLIFIRLCSCTATEKWMGDDNRICYFGSDVYLETNNCCPVNRKNFRYLLKEKKITEIDNGQIRRLTSG